ncbi:MAG: cytidine deaminase [bacterium]|nr:cytidine deaminase [bacterium]
MISLTQAQIDTLIAAALKARDHAYIPYSGYGVGAALLTLNDGLYTGCNVENAAYPATICAERVALVKAISEGERQFGAVAVVTANGGAPCGVCRQMLYEFAPDLRVILADTAGGVIFDGALKTLLPLGFGPEFLNVHSS